ncbi:MAG: peptide chain release factor N(5)-glutamine methyltransferase [Acutalibacteraceae bacterium]|nr:peptide chain release factor N(5)-glutamine methyltransferase [Acutalibacteraceae bacterium]
MTAEQVLRTAAEKLRAAQIENASFDASCLVENITGLSRTKIMLCDDDIADEQAELVERAVLRRISGEPLQYILGEWDFFGRTFEVGEGVLVPRPETELLVELAIEKLRNVRYPVVFDLCAGSGCVGLTIAAERPDAHVWLFEKYDEAFHYLKRNIKKLGLTNVQAVQHDITLGYDDKISETPDLIVSNPPYLRTDELGGLSTEVMHEPVTALDGGKDGVDFYRIIASRWLPNVNKHGGIILECDPSQTLEIADMLMPYAMRVKIVTDIFGLQRAVYADTF